MRRVDGGLAVLELREHGARTANDGCGHARELGHRNAVAAARRTFLDLMQEDDLRAGLSGGDMHVGGLLEVDGKLRELEVVGREERERASRLDEFLSDRACKRQAVERGRASADFVHQHERAVGCLMKDRGSLRHFDHEGRAAAGKIVGCADAGVNAVDGTDRDRFPGTNSPPTPEA